VNGSDLGVGDTDHTVRVQGLNPLMGFIPIHLLGLLLGGIVTARFDHAHLFTVHIHNVRLHVFVLVVVVNGLSKLFALA
jgi:hypothetical protein